MKPSEEAKFLGIQIDERLSFKQKIQNEALRVCQRMPGYIRVSLLHEYASLETFDARMLMLNSRLLKKMYRHNADIRNLVENHINDPTIT